MMDLILKLISVIFAAVIMYLLMICYHGEHLTTVPQPLPSMRAVKQAPQEEKVPFLAVNGTKTLLLSAYMEHRRRRQVRVIAVMLRSETPAYRCLLCCNDKRHVSEGVGDAINDHFDFDYGTVHIMCPLPSGCDTPSHVAVTTAAAKSEDSQEVFLKIKNQKAESVSFAYNFTVCISTMFDFTNVLQLVQSLEMMRILGVNKVAIYKTSCSPETQRVLDYYTKTGFVDLIPWTISRHINPSHGWLPSHGPGDIHYYGQIPALNDCLYRYMYQSRYVSLQDLDELLLPQSVDSWLDLLPLLEKKYGVNKCYMFENNVFPKTVSLPAPVSKPQSSQSPGWQEVPGVNILAHLHQEPIIKDTHYSNFKIIVNPQAVFRPTVHGLLESENGCSWVDRNIVRMYHTRSAMQPELKPEELIYDGRLLSYSSRLTPAVNTVLTETEFLPSQVESN